jgi:hypothetical protein
MQSLIMVAISVFQKGTILRVSHLTFESEIFLSGLLGLPSGNRVTAM